MALPFFTIGHSTRSIDEFVDLLSNAEVRLVIDVRTIPRSRTNPQYNSEALAEALSESRIDYAHIAALGGLRGRKRDVPADVNAFWQVAMPPTDRRLSDRRRRDGIPHSRAGGAEATGLHANTWMIFWRALISGHT